MGKEKNFPLNKWIIVGTTKNSHVFPCLQGIYIIFIDNLETMTRTVQYVGQTSNFNKRFSCHKVFYEIKKLCPCNSNKLLTIKIKRTTNRQLLEKKLIQKLKPPYNKFYNWGYL